MPPKWLLLLLCALWALLPLSRDPYVHIDRRALLLWLAGGIAIVTICVRWGRERWGASRVTSARTKSQQNIALWWIYAAGICASTACSYAPLHSLTGGETHRIGALSLLAAMAIAVALQRHAGALLLALYLQSIAMVLVALSWHHQELLVGIRLKAPMFQANALAAWLACGAIAGWAWFANAACSQRQKVGFLVGQLLVLAGIFLTQSRGAVVLLAAFGLCWAWQQRRAVNENIRKAWSSPPTRRWLLLWGGVAMGAFAFGAWQMAQRVPDMHALQRAIVYRWGLLHHGLLLLTELPLWGWGPDMLYEVFGALHPLPPMLQNTFGEGTLIDSTHNVYLDRWLELGWANGVLYILLVWGGLWRGRNLGGDYRGLWAMALFLAIRQLWSVTTLELVCLLWLMLAKLWFASDDDLARPACSGSRDDGRGLRDESG